MNTFEIRPIDIKYELYKAVLSNYGASVLNNNKNVSEQEIGLFLAGISRMDEKTLKDNLDTIEEVNKKSFNSFYKVLDGLLKKKSKP